MITANATVDTTIVRGLACYLRLLKFDKVFLPVGFDTNDAIGPHMLAGSCNPPPNMIELFQPTSILKLVTGVVFKLLHPIYVGTNRRKRTARPTM